jgi:ATP-dependent Clp protease ATP-binding subunit ClpA
MPTSDEGGCDIFSSDGRLRNELFDAATARALDAAARQTEATRWDCVRSPHLFMGLLSAPDAGVTAWAERLGAEPPRLLDQFADLFYQKDTDPVGGVPLHREFLSDNVIRLLREAHLRSSAAGRRRVTAMDLLITLFTVPNSIVAECFERLGVTAAKLTELAVLAEQQVRPA